MLVRLNRQGRVKAHLTPVLKPMLLMLLGVAIVFGLLFGFVQFRAGMIKKYLAGAAATPQVVSVVTAAYADWQPTLSAVGTFHAVNGADLALETSGIVEKIHFRSGDEVTAGQLLLELRKDVDDARLQALKATAELSAINLRRDQSQLKIRAASQAMLDTDEANLKNARAEVAQQEAVIAQKSLRAPFAGRLGIRQVDLGQFVSAGTMVVTLQSLDSIYLDFLLPQQALKGLSTDQAITVRVDAYPNETFAGQIVAISPKVDLSNRNVPVRATLANPDLRLRPGMFASVSITTGAAQRQITLPQTAIVYASYGNSVFIVKENEAVKDPKAPGRLAARRAFVKLGATRGDEVAVLEGVPEGTTVVSAGQMKLKNGTPLTISAAPPPTVESDPKIMDQ